LDITSQRCRRDEKFPALKHPPAPVSSPSTSSSAAAAMLSGDIPPNQTIYLRNLNEKLKKEGNRTHLPAPRPAAEFLLKP
jgi:hypothetical protein